MTQPRITVDEVRAAYEKCGLSPIRKFWLLDGSRLCCPQTAILASDGLDVFVLTDLCTPAAKRWGSDYAAGFRDGFDGRECYGDHPEWKQAHADGVAVAAAIFGETSNQPA